MDMQLTPKYADDAGSGNARAQGIAIDPRVVQNLGVRLETAELGGFARVIDAVGEVSVDEHGIEVIEVRQPAGWKNSMCARPAIRYVAGSGSPAFTRRISWRPSRELLIARESAEPGLIEAARQRLALFGLSAPQIARIEKTGHAERRVGYFAPFDGYVMELGVRQGRRRIAGNGALPSRRSQHRLGHRRSARGAGRVDQIRRSGAGRGAGPARPAIQRPDRLSLSRAGAGHAHPQGSSGGSESRTAIAPCHVRVGPFEQRRAGPGC